MGSAVKTKRRKSLIAYITPDWHKSFYIEKEGRAIHYMHDVLWQKQNEFKTMKKVKITIQEI